MNSDSKTWGEWIRRRAHRVGIRRQLDLAAALGCSEDQVCRWMKATTPPRRINKGVDRKLGIVLQTTPEMLFTNWAATPPEDAKIVTAAFTAGDEPALRRKVQALVELLDGESLDALYAQGRELLAHGSRGAA